MAKTRKAPRWRGPFLRALARTGNVEVAAEMAGVDKSTVYLRRKADRDFARRWDAAAARGKARAGTPLRFRASSRTRSARGEELILRVSKRGAQLVRPGEGRWSTEIEEAFLDHYRQSGCIRWAAKAAGVSANTILARRKTYADFAARCAAAAEAADERLRDYVRSAGLATFDPELPQDETPKVSIAEAIAIIRLKGPGGKAEAPIDLPPIEEVRDEVLRRIAAIRRHREEGGGSDGQA